MKNKNYMFNKLRNHIGHAIDVVGYSDTQDDYQNISIECLDCNEVLIDYEKDEDTEEDI